MDPSEALMLRTLKWRADDGAPPSGCGQRRPQELSSEGRESLDHERERLGWDVVSGPEELDADGLTGLVNIDHHTIAEENGPDHRLVAHLEVASVGLGIVLHVHILHATHRLRHERPP